MADSNNPRSPTLDITVKPAELKGLRVCMLITPLNAFGPKKAELAPTMRSTFCTSISDEPKKFPKEKLSPGAWLSTPSINCKDLTGDVLLKPLVLMTLKPILAAVKSTPFNWPKPS